MAPVTRRGTRNIRWIEAHLVVPEGSDVGKPVRLRPWQKRIIRRIYDTPTRRALISFARKNGKTSLAAMLLLLHLVGPEARANSQLYSAAQSREQAGIVFMLAAKMVRLSPTLSAYVTVKETAKTLVCPELGTLYRALSAEVTTSYGFSPVFVIHDELGQVEGPTSPLYEALETAMGAHRDPLSITISTQAPSDAALLSVLIDEARTGADPTTKLFLFAAEPDAPIDSRASWRAANPALGDFRSEEDVADQAARAARLPSFEAGFRNLILNQRVAAESRFVSVGDWQACGGDVPGDLVGHPTVLAIDLGATSDLTAIVGVTALPDEILAVTADVFVPGEALGDRAQRARVPYDVWARQGVLTATPGTTVGYDFVAAALLERLRDRRPDLIVCDPWRMQVLLAELRDAGASVQEERYADDHPTKAQHKWWRLEYAGETCPLEPFIQGFRSMAPAIDALERALLEHRVRHGNHPVLTWQAGNIAVDRDPAGNRKFTKRRSAGKIDAMVALVMAVGSLTTLTEVTPWTGEVRFV